jgi:large subunit ribosomal protein L21
MYAIVRTGGKQYQVAQGDQLRVESLAGNVGETVELDDILLVADGDKVRIGKPQVAGAKVTATIVEQGKAKKVLVYKKKRRQGYEVKNGHRQQYTALRIDGISAA